MKHIKHTQEEEDRSLFGFWIYLMTDCMLFASLFATYAVLRNSTYGGPAAAELFSANFVLVETLLLLTSSFTCGLALINLQDKKRKYMLRWLFITFLLGVSFLTMELVEFSHLVQEGHSWTASAYMSSFFTLVGTHGLHIFIGLIWILVLFYQILMKGLKPAVTKKIKMFGLFWHFLDVIWIFIFTFVYMAGILKI